MLNTTIKHLVFEGGGWKIDGHVGAACELENYVDTDCITDVAGASAGAIIALLWSVGYRAADRQGQRFLDLLNSVDSSVFVKKEFIGKHLYSLLKHRGWYDTAMFEKWLQSVVAEKAFNAEITFSELYYLTGKRLHVVATLPKRQKAVVFSMENSPMYSVVRAVVHSMSIPFFFKPLTYNSERVTDGGLTLNYPIKLFDTEAGPSEATLGFRLDSSKEIEAVRASGLWETLPMQGDGFRDFLLQHLNLLYEKANKVHLDKADYARTVFIDTLEVGTFDYDKPREKSIALYEQGVKAVKEYFSDCN